MNYPADSTYQPFDYLIDYAAASDPVRLCMSSTPLPQLSSLRMAQITPALLTAANRRHLH